MTTGWYNQDNHFKVPLLSIYPGIYNFYHKLEKVEAKGEATTKEVDRLHQVLYDNTGNKWYENKFIEMCACSV